MALGDLETMLVRLAALSLGTALLFAVGGCSGDGAPESGASVDEVNSGNNSDVQVISAKADGTIQWGVGGFEGYDSKKCNYFDKQPYGTSSSGFTSRAKADCTDALIGKLGLTVNRYIEPQAAIREGADGSVTYSSFRNWCGKLDVVVAVKAAAWDAPSFKGIGFYADVRAINEGQTRVFYEKSDTRLARIGEATLKKENHQRVYLYKFAGAGPCEANGTGDNPGSVVELKPYVTFDGDHERWEGVPGNHRVGYGQQWDRRGELLD